MMSRDQNIFGAGTQAALGQALAAARMQGAAPGDELRLALDILKQSHPNLDTCHARSLIHDAYSGRTGLRHLLGRLWARLTRPSSTSGIRPG